MARPVTIKDVAQRAGCGIATVSRVLNGTGPASADARARVEQAAHDLGFAFSDLGRSLQSQRTRTIGCVVPSVVNPVFADAVQAIQGRLLEAGYHLMLMCSSYDPALEREAVEMLLRKKVEGLILTVSTAEDGVAEQMAADHEVPLCLLFNAPTGRTAAAFVDNRSAARSVAAEFAAMGHRQTGFLALRFNASDRSRHRYEGFAEGCAALGLQPPVLIEIDESSDDLPAQLAALLREHAGLTGLFASNDFLAMAAMQAAQSIGLTVPGDLSIVGFDGIAMGAVLVPPLATVVTPPRDMGLSAANAVLAMIDAGGGPDGARMEHAFSFRGEGTLGRPRTRKADDTEAATSAPSIHPEEDRNPLIGAMK